MHSPMFRKQEEKEMRKKMASKWIFQLPASCFARAKTAAEETVLWILVIAVANGEMLNKNISFTKRNRPDDLYL